VETGDLNGDGKTDVVLYNSRTGTMYAGISKGDGTFTYVFINSSPHFTYIRLADFTGDGNADLFFYRAGDGAKYLAVGDGTGVFTIIDAFSIDPGYYLADVGDLNGDGRADLILYNSTNGQAVTAISNGAGFTFTPLILTPGFTSVRLADYTGDGNADVTLYDKISGVAYLGTGTGTGTFSFQSLSWSPDYDYVIPEDVNCDGKVDVILYNSATGTEYTGISNGDGSFNYVYSFWGPGKVPVDQNHQAGRPVTSDLSLDTPRGGSVSTPFLIAGWALNRGAATGTGVDAVHVYATLSGGSPVFLGVATYGVARSDIGTIYGSQFTNSGWTLSSGSLTPGAYTISVFARNASTGTFDAAASANVTVTAPVSRPAIAVDTPTAGQTVTSAFEVGGWALDSGAASGTGVDAITFYVQPAGAPAPGVFIGTGSYGAARGDVAALFGARFTAVGFHFTITGMSPGTFTLNVIAHDTLTNSNSIVKSVPFTVSATALMSVDVPSAEATIAAATFTIGGWSIDRTVEGTTMPGSGVDAVHIYAFPNPGSGQAPIFLGVATLGASRPDVGGFYGSRYGLSGYNLTVNRGALGLGPGVYSIGVVSHSAVSGTFNNTAVVRVTLQ
jgi:hypothetical protein